MIDEEIIDEFPVKSDFGTLRRKRTALKVYRKRLIRMSKTNYYCSGAYPVDKEGNYCNLSESVRLKRYWRGQRSHYIKKNCNRRFRRSSKLNMLAGKQRAIYRKALEFWWEYD